jgi:hypothetical protein
LTSFDPRCWVSPSLKVNMTPLSFYKRHPWVSLSSLFMWTISSSLALTWRQSLRFRLCCILHSTWKTSVSSPIFWAWKCIINLTVSSCISQV